MENPFNLSDEKLKILLGKIVGSGFTSSQDI